MEFNGMINRLLSKDPAGRARKLRLRTYAVICLNEECGVLEWVQVCLSSVCTVHLVRPPCRVVVVVVHGAGCCFVALGGCVSCRVAFCAYFPEKEPERTVWRF